MSSQEARDAGRGVFFIAGAKLYFMAAGAALTFAMPNILDEATYGAYGQVVSIASWVNNVMVVATIQAVARFTAQNRDRARAFQAAGFRMHLRIGAPIAVLFAIALAPLMSWFLKDAGKAGPLALAALVVAGYSFYAVFVGTANGLRAFHKQAGLDVSFATMRVGAIVGLAAAGFGVYGAIAGWVAAVAVILIVAALWIGLPRRQGAAERAQDPVALAPMMRFFASVAVYLLLFNLIMFVDLALLKRYAALTLAARGLSPAEAATQADVLAGYYWAAQQFARLSYQAIIAATFVIFPLISRATFDRERTTTARYIRTTTRYSLIFAGAFAAVFMANPHEVLDLPFRRAFADNGAAALVALAAGNIAFAVLAVVGTILNGAGRIRAAIAMALAATAAAVIGNAAVLPRVAPGPDALLACAAVTALSMTLGAAVGGALMHRRLGAFIPASTVIRTALALAVAVAAGRAIPLSGALLTVVEAAAVGIIYLGGLVALRELRRADIQAIIALRRARTD